MSVRPGGLVLGAVLALALAPGPALCQAPADDGELALPMTIDRVWYRGGKVRGWAGVRGHEGLGDLVITEQGLEFESKKTSFSIPFQRVRSIALGQLGKNVDTNWAVLGIEDAAGQRVLAFRDGRKLGYGQRTRHIYLFIRRAMRAVEAGPYAAPEGFTVFAGIDDQATLQIPAEWKVFLARSTVVNGRSPWGSIVFSPELDREQADSQLQQALRGEIPAILVHRVETTRGARCDGIAERARPQVQALAAEKARWGGIELQGAAESTPQEVDGCTGLKLGHRGALADGGRLIIDQRVVARDDTLFIFEHRRRAEDGGDAVAAALERMVDSVRFVLTSP